MLCTVILYFVHVTFVTKSQCVVLLRSL